MKSLVIIPALALLVWSAASQAREPSVEAPEMAVADSSAQEGAAEARAAVELLHEVLIGCMKDAEQLGFQGRFDRIASNLEKTYDLPFMARTLVGKRWKELTQEQREDFIVLSRGVSASRYADNFDSYGGQSFETHSVEAAARGTILVKTELVQPKDRNVDFDYRLRKAGGRWRIIDVYLDGTISELALWRSQYRFVMENEGFAKLVEALEKKIAERSRE
jgi:phospholipid transport system substrate-binding protein